MCGIAGILRLDGGQLPGPALDAVKAMTDSMTWRGPDGEGQWLDGPVCLGHRRLSIIDIAGGSQPMSYADGRLHIVFNGEIYNFRELRSDLEKNGASFRTNCDTEVILAAYEHYGDDCLDYLEGMFAFALWDSRNSKLFCARDHFGKKPFYYTIQNGYLAFASELGALTVLRGGHGIQEFSFRVDPSALTRYLAYEYVPTPQCIYAEVRVLEPSHCMTLENGKCSVRRFWDLPMPATKMPAPERELSGELYRLMGRATKMRMVSDVPLGVFLSGGIDSTIVAGLMSSFSLKPIQSFSIGFKEQSYDESGYARIAARAYGADHHERILSAEECADELPGIVRRMDTPMADASCAPTWLLAALARENVTVALGGDGADELWAGYEHYIGFRIAELYNDLPRWLRKNVIERLVRLLPESAGYINPRLAVSTFLRGASAPAWQRVQTMLTAFTPAMERKIIDANWLRAYGNDLLDNDVLFSPTRAQYDHWQAADGTTPLARAFHVYARQFMLDDILVKVDRCTMLHSLETRSPFLDKKVSEFVAALPVNCKLRGFKRKYLLKKTFAKLLPPKILGRNKRGFQIPVAAWLRGKLKPLLLELLSPEFLKKQAIFNSFAVDDMMQKHFSEKYDFRKPLWTLLVFQLWWQANKPSF